MKPVVTRVVFCVFLFLLVMVSAAYFWQYPAMLAVFFMVVAALLLSRWHCLEDIVYFSVALVIAPLGELMAIKKGAWQYAGIEGGIPIWLPLGWALCAISLRRLSEAIVEIAEWKRRPALQSSQARSGSVTP